MNEFEDAFVVHLAAVIPRELLLRRYDEFQLMGSKEAGLMIDLLAGYLKPEDADKELLNRVNRLLKSVKKEPLTCQE